MQVQNTFDVPFNEYKEIVRGFNQVHTLLPQPVDGARKLEKSSEGGIVDTTKLSFFKKDGTPVFSYETRHDLSNGSVKVVYEGDARDFGYGEIGYLWGCQWNRKLMNNLVTVAKEEV